jgi:hypothetical protein
MTDNMIRSLMVEGYVEHGVETTVPGASERRFRWGGHLPFCNQSCFILTSPGATWAREFVAQAAQKNPEAPASPPTPSFENSGRENGRSLEHTLR